jgi:hypothetical protein
MKQRLVHRVGNYKLFQGAQGWEISVAFDGVWLRFRCGEEKPEIKDPKIVLEFESSPDAKP